MVAPEAIVIFAVRLLEPLTVVELTVTPPGFVVPVMNHWALAPFLNPLPLTVTFRLMVPWAAELGLVELTWIWPSAPTAPAKRNVTDKANSLSDEVVIILLPQPTCRGNSRIPCCYIRTSISFPRF